MINIFDRHNGNGNNIVINANIYIERMNFSSLASNDNVIKKTLESLEKKLSKSLDVTLYQKSSSDRGAKELKVETVNSVAINTSHK